MTGFVPTTGLITDEEFVVQDELRQGAAMLSLGYRKPLAGMEAVGRAVGAVGAVNAFAGQPGGKRRRKLSGTIALADPGARNTAVLDAAEARLRPDAGPGAPRRRASAAASLLSPSRRPGLRQSLVRRRAQSQRRTPAKGPRVPSTSQSQLRMVAEEPSSAAAAPRPGQLPHTQSFRHARPPQRRSRRKSRVDAVAEEEPAEAEAEVATAEAESVDTEADAAVRRSLVKSKRRVMYQAAHGRSNASFERAIAPAAHRATAAFVAQQGGVGGGGGDGKRRKKHRHRRSRPRQSHHPHHARKPRHRHHHKGAKGPTVKPKEANTKPEKIMTAHLSKKKKKKKSKVDVDSLLALVHAPSENTTASKNSKEKSKRLTVAEKREEGWVGIGAARERKGDVPDWLRS